MANGSTSAQAKTSRPGNRCITTSQAAAVPTAAVITATSSARPAEVAA